MTELVEKPKDEVRTYSRFSEADVRRGLIEVAACSGNTHMASRNLAEDGIVVEQSTLWRWINQQHTEQYERIRAEILPKITAAAAEQHMDLARRQTEVSSIALEQIQDRLPQMEDKDLINAMGKADIGSGIHTEKAQLLSGQPTHRADKSVAELLKGLAGKGLQLGERREESDGSVVERVAVLPPAECG